MTAKLKHGKALIEDCPHCSGPLAFKGVLHVDRELFWGLQCRKCTRGYVLRWEYDGWKEIPKDLLKGILQP
jgi:hypothetical protein